MQTLLSFFLPPRRILPFLFLAFWLTRQPVAFTQSASLDLTSAKLQIARSYGALPLSFENN